MPTKKINNKLPKPLQSKRIEANFQRNISYESFLIKTEPIKKVIDIVKDLPGFKLEIIVKRLPRLIKEPDTRKMSVKVAKGVAEKSMVRLVKVAAGVTQ